MESLTRLVTDSLVRHGLDRPIDPRRLQWSRWSRCDSTHSLLVVPSKPGIFALAEEVAALGGTSQPRTPHRSEESPAPQTTHVGTAALGCPAEQSSAAASTTQTTAPEGHDFSRAAAVTPSKNSPPSATEQDAVRRMLAVLQFCEDDDMAFTLDRMFTRINPMRARLASGRCFLRFVVIEDQAQRQSICAALNQWLISSSEKATGLPSDFSSSLELAPVTARVGRTPLSDSVDAIRNQAQGNQPIPETGFAPAAPHLDSGANKNLHCPHPLPSGF